jgi:ABC-2 type transport system permease protein
MAADLRLARRRLDIIGRVRRRPAGLLALVCALVVFHALAYFAARWLVNAHADPQRQATFLAVLATAMLFIAPWLTSQALTNATRSLYSRGDLDLLLVSPVPGGRILAARAFSICLEALGAVALFVAPIANMCLWLGGARWLSLYATLLGAGLLATALGLALALGLFALVGPRRTRIVAQALAMFIGGGFALGLHAINLAPRGFTASIVAGIEAPTPGGWLDPAGALWLPVRAASGDGLALMLWIALGVFAFSAVSLALGARFRQASALASATGSEAPRTAAVRSRRLFHAGVGANLRRKEWLSLLRDPWLLSQIAMQTVYTLPIVLVLWRSQTVGGDLAFALGPALVVVASQFAASLAWLAVSSEDAPEFLATAPVAARTVTVNKMLAVATPLVILLGPVALSIAFHAPRDGAFVALIACCAGGSTALLNVWHPSPAPRAALMRRHAQSKIIAVVEHFLSLLWAVTLTLMLMETWWAALPAALAALTLTAYRGGHTSGRGA